MTSYLTTAEAAKVLGMGPHAVRMLVRDGKLAVHYLGPKGGLIRFTEADLELYLESCRSFGSRAASHPKASRDRGSRNGAEPSKRPDDLGPSDSTESYLEPRIALNHGGFS